MIFKTLRAHNVSISLAGSTQSNMLFKVNKLKIQFPDVVLILLFCWSWLACADIAILSALVYFDWSLRAKNLPISLKNDARAA